MSIDKTNSTPKKRSFLQRLGPGIITAALVFGPGSLTLNTKLGAGFGYSLFWVIILAMVFMEAYTRMSTSRLEPMAIRNRYATCSPRRSV